MQIKIVFTGPYAGKNQDILNDAYNLLITDNNGVYKIQKIFDDLIPTIKEIVIYSKNEIMISKNRQFEFCGDDTLAAGFDEFEESQFSCFVDALYHSWINAQNDPINPSYYKKNGIEVIEYIESITKNLHGILAVDTGNVVKYMSRWFEKHTTSKTGEIDLKKGVKDLKKAAWYLNHLINKVEELEQIEKGDAQNED